MMRSLPSDLWMGWVMEIGVLEKCGRRIGSVGDVHWAQYLMGVLGYGFEVGVEEAEVVAGDK